MNNHQKRLAIFIPSMRLGGAERSMIKLAQGLIAKKFEVDLILAQKEGEYLSEIPKLVRVFDLKAKRVLWSLPALINYLRRERPFALLSVMDYANIISLMARRLSGVSTRIVVSERNTVSQVAQNASSWRQRLMPYFIKRFYPWADRIVAVSKGVATDLIKQFNFSLRHIQVIYNPIITSEMKKLAKSPLNHPWFEEDQPPVLLALGRLCPQKDFPTLIKAFAQFKQSKQARLLILGEGPDRSSLEKLILQYGLENDIDLPGFVQNPYPYMTRASLFILSSRWEGLPGVLIEALFCGPPIIATDCLSGPREILKNGKYGKLVSVGDVDALAKSIELSLNGKSHTRPKDCYKPFEQETIVQQYLDVLLGQKSTTL